LTSKVVLEEGILCVRFLLIRCNFTGLISMKGGDSEPFGIRGIREEFQKKHVKEVEL
jgi:hypothetical protein